MSVEIQWNDLDPATGDKRFVSVERFAGRWTFKVRFRRRENWQKVDHPTRAMWEELLDAIERRLPRREGVTDADVSHVKERLRDPKLAVAEPGVAKEEPESPPGILPVQLEFGG